MSTITTIVFFFFLGINAAQAMSISIITSATMEEEPQCPTEKVADLHSYEADFQCTSSRIPLFGQGQGLSLSRAKYAARIDCRDRYFFETERKCCMDGQPSNEGHNVKKICLK